MPESTPDAIFDIEYQQELEVWLRRRFRLFSIFALLVICLSILVRVLIGGDHSDFWIMLASGGVMVGIVGFFVINKQVSAGHREQILRAALLMILLLGLTRVAAEVYTRLLTTESPSSTIWVLVGWHFGACLFLPWRWHESLKPFVPVLVAWAAAVLLLPGEATMLERVLGVSLAPALFLPGLAICARRMDRHSREFRTRMVGRQFLSLRRELDQARRIHEGMFPKAYRDEYIRFDYAFSPTRELGGDFIRLHLGRDGVATITLLDVTGHGLAAALTVNRIQGELERIRAESERAHPSEMFTLLNRYVHLTLARHSIYVTGVCASFDPRDGTLRWVNAGHPPGFIRHADGSVTELGSTTLIMGAVGDAGFSPGEQMYTCAPGDTLIMYTDGVFEARDREGRPLGLKTLRRLMRRSEPPANWPRYIIDKVNNHLGGRADDDMLVTALHYLRVRATAAEEDSVADDQRRSAAALDPVTLDGEHADAASGSEIVSNESPNV